MRQFYLRMLHLARRTLGLVWIVILVLDPGSPAICQGRSEPPLPSIGDFTNAKGQIDLEALRSSGYQGPVDLQGRELRLSPGGGAVAQSTEGDDTWADGFNENGPTGPVYALGFHGGYVIMGGDFEQAGQATEATSLVAWNAGDWVDLGGEINGCVNAVTTYDNPVTGLSELIVGGDFSSPTADFVMRWDGSAWHALTGGAGSPTGPVYALAVYDGEVIAGGSFPGLPFNNIARWDPTSGWSALSFSGGIGVTGTGAEVRALEVLPGSPTMLVVGGSFDTAGIYIVSNIAGWDGTDWVPYNPGLGGEVYALERWNGQLFAGGAFLDDTSGIPLYHLARWTGSAWNKVGPGTGGGLDNDVLALASRPDGLYVAGSFLHSSTGFPLSFVARWFNGSWWSLPTGTSDEGAGDVVRALAHLAGPIYMGGDFVTVADNLGASHVAIWYASNWAALDGDGMTDVVRALTVYNLRLIAGGDFLSAGGVAANCIASWDGEEWSTLGSGLEMSAGQDTARVYALTVFQGDLIAGGDFDQAGGNPALNIARWDGSLEEWFPLGNGLDGSGGVYALAADESLLVAGGAFTFEPGSPATALYRIAAWDGSAWSTLGAADVGFDNPVWALDILDSHFVAAGDFIETQDGAITLNHIARWEGNWLPMSGTGIAFDGSIRALVVHDDPVDGLSLYAGGFFQEPYDHIARWDVEYSDWFPLSGGGQDGVDGPVYALGVYNDSLIVGGSFNLAGGDSASHVVRWNSGGQTWIPLGSGTDNSVLALEPYDLELYAGGKFLVAGGKASARVAERLEALAADVPVPTITGSASIQLLPGAPNPFVRSQRLRFILAGRARVTLDIADVTGRRLRRVHDGVLEGGAHEILWDGTDDAGRLVGPGVYFLRLRAGGQSADRKLVRIR